MKCCVLDGVAFGDVGSAGYANKINANDMSANRNDIHQKLPRKKKKKKNHLWPPPPRNLELKARNFRHRHDVVRSFILRLE